MSRTTHARPRKRSAPKDGPPVTLAKSRCAFDWAPCHDPRCARCGKQSTQGTMVEAFTPTTRPALDIALASAKAHGEQSEPDHEVGDLLELIEALYAEMGEDQRKRALAKYGEGREWWR